MSCLHGFIIQVYCFLSFLAPNVSFRFQPSGPRATSAFLGKWSGELERALVLEQEEQSPAWALSFTGWVVWAGHFSQAGLAVIQGLWVRREYWAVDGTREENAQTPSLALERHFRDPGAEPSLGPASVFLQVSVCVLPRPATTTDSIAISTPHHSPTL